MVHLIALGTRKETYNPGLRWYGLLQNSCFRNSYHSYALVSYLLTCSNVDLTFTHENNFRTLSYVDLTQKFSDYKITLFIRMNYLYASHIKAFFA